MKKFNGRRRKLDSNPTTEMTQPPQKKSKSASASNSASVAVP